jgi:hypothetical protein
VAFVGNRRHSYRSWWEDLRPRDYLKDLRVDVSEYITGMDLQEVVWGGSDWIDLA